MIAPPELGHAAHVLIDAAVFVVPVGGVALTLLIANLRDRRRS